MFRIVKASTTSGDIGIWWYTDDGEVIGLQCSLDEGENSGDQIEYPYEKNHLNSFTQIVNEFRPNDAQDIIRLGYKGLERGRVYYEIATHCYHVTCSEAMKRDREFKAKLKDFYHLNGCMVQFDMLNHYCKLPLTGNPAVDDFNYE